MVGGRWLVDDRIAAHGMRRPRGIFVAGTDTGVGKTAVACALAAWCRREKLDVGVMKPVATGGRRLPQVGAGTWVSDDAVRLARAAGVDDPWTRINPVCFREPLAPWTAAIRKGSVIRMDRLLRAFRWLAARHECLIVEGIGGLLVPLTGRIMMADLAKRMRLPLLLVARPGLGTLNHTLLSLACARRLKLPFLGVVIVHSRPRPRHPMARVAERTNPDVLRRFTRLLGVLPFQPEVLSRGEEGHLAEWIQRHLGRQILRRLVG